MNAMVRLNQNTDHQDDNSPAIPAEKSIKHQLLQTYFIVINDQHVVAVISLHDIQQKSHGQLHIAYKCR